MSLTKVSHSMLQGVPVSVLDSIPSIYHADILAGNNTVALDAYIQPVLDANLYVYFPTGLYCVNSLTTTLGSQIIEFDTGCYIRGVATTATTAIFRFRKIQGRYLNLQIDGNSNTNYTSAIRLDASSNTGDNYPGRCRWTNLVIANIQIGVLVGVNTGTSVDAPVSENHFIGGEFRNVERCFFMNQTNGFIFVTGMLVDCNNYSSTWNSTNAVAAELAEGWAQFTNCDFVKADSDLGYLFVVQGTSVLTVSNGQAEAACTNFLGTGTASIFIEGYRNNYLSGDVPVITLAGSGIFEATNFYYKRSDAKSTSQLGTVYTDTGSNWIVNFSNSMFYNQLQGSVLFGATGLASTCDVKFSNCNTFDGAIGKAKLSTQPTEVSKGLTNLPTSGAVVPVAYFGTTVGGTSILQLTDATADFDRCIEMIAGAGSNILDCNGTAGLIPYSGRAMVLEWWQKAVAGANGFSGSLQAIFTDAAGVATSYNLQSTAVDGRVGNIAVGNTGAIDWTRNQIIIPAYYAKSVGVSVRFTQAATSQTWRIAGLRVY